jgi:hypothetical protein
MLIAMEEIANELIAFCNQKIKVLNKEKAPRKARTKNIKKTSANRSDQDIQI